jgi:hypothetical protein
MMCINCLMWRVQNNEAVTSIYVIDDGRRVLHAFLFIFLFLSVSTSGPFWLPSVGVSAFERLIVALGTHSGIETRLCLHELYVHIQGCV